MTHELPSNHSESTDGLPNKSRMIPPEDLKWGQTPFDNLTRNELLRLVQAYHSALISMGGPLHSLLQGNESHPYWMSPNGSGYAVKAKWDALMNLAGNNQDGGEAEYCKFYRYADGLLFPGIGSPWKVYPDGTMSSPGYAPGGRPLTWSDLAPR